MKVVIIGGGASGLVAGIIASQKNNVTIIERNNECAKKILATGNGKCNYFNSEINNLKYYTDDYDILDKILSEENISSALKLFDELGVIPRIKNGYYYPYSNQATSIKSLLVREVKNRNIKVYNDLEVNDVIKIENKFIINPNKEKIEADKLILATGSNASTKFENTGLDIASKFLSIKKPLPALVQLRSYDTFKECSGVRCDAKLTLYVDDLETAKEEGELQLTDYGISGICVLNISSIVSRSLNDKKLVTIKINFLPMLDKNNFINWMDERCLKLPNRDIVELLESILPYKLLYFLIKKANLKKDQSWNLLSIKEKQKLMELLFDYSLKISGTNEIAKAQVVTGGVNLSQINPYTMEAKQVKNLYVIGELLNVDGKCGGYNLAFAWITGIIVGRNL